MSQTGTVRLSLAAGQYPISKTNHEIHVRARINGAGSGTIRCQIYQGGVLISFGAFYETNPLTTALATYTILVPDKDAAVISDYSDLEIRLWGFSTGTVFTTPTFEIDQAWLQIPKSGTASASKSLTSSYNIKTKASKSLTATYGVSGKLIKSLAVSYSLLGTAKQTGVARISLAGGVTPVAGTIYLNIRARIASGGAGTIRATLYQDTFQVSTVMETGALGGTLTDISLPVTISIPITSYANLEIRLWGYAAGGNAPVFEVDQVWLQIPQPSSTVVLKTLTPSYKVISRVAKTLTASYQIISAAAALTGVARVLLTSGQTPSSRTAHSITVRARVQSGTGRIRAALYEGTVNRSTDLETTDLTTSLASYLLTIRNSDAATIVDYSNLELRLWGVTFSGGAVVFEIDQASFATPDPAITVQKTLDANYNLAGRTSRVMIASYNVPTRLAKALVASYNVQAASVVTKTLTASYAVSGSIITVVGLPSTPTSHFVIVHYDHSGSTLGEIFAENLQFSKTLKEPGTISYEMDLSHPMAHPLYTSPYGTDFILFNDDVPIMGGLHTEVQISDKSDNRLQIAGKDWLHYLERRMWPFDPDNPSASLYLVFQRNVMLVVQDILNTIMADPNSLQYTLEFAYVDQDQINYEPNWNQTPPGGLSPLINYEIDPGDTDTILSKLQTLGTTLPGFDFDTTWDKRLRFYLPRKGSRSSVVFEQDVNISKLSYGNQGPLSTHFLGTSSIDSSRVGKVREDTSISTRYRRLDGSKDFGDIIDDSQLNFLADVEYDRQKTISRPITATWIGDSKFFWSQAEIGTIVRIVGSTGYEDIDENLRIVGVQSTVNNEGDEDIEVTLDDATISL